MKVGILGSGLMGGKLGTIFARAGHEIIFSYSHDDRKLERLAREAGDKASAGTPAEAARRADTLLLAVHWQRVDDVLGKAGDRDVGFTAIDLGPLPLARYTEPFAQLMAHLAYEHDRGPGVAYQVRWFKERRRLKSGDNAT